MSAREKLSAAHGARLEAEDALARAREATGRARELLTEITREVERLREVGRRVATTRAASLKDALKAGAAPTFAEAPDLPRNAALLADAEGRLAAVTQTVAELAEEERAASRAVDAAKGDVGEAVKQVLLEEVELLAVTHEAISAQLRPVAALLGTELSFVARIPGPISPLAQSVIAANTNSEMASLETFAWRAAKAANEHWSDFAAALASDSHAILKVTAVTAPPLRNDNPFGAIASVVSLSKEALAQARSRMEAKA